MLPAFNTLDDTALRQLEMNPSLSDSEWRAVVAEIVRRSDQAGQRAADVAWQATGAASLVACPVCGRHVSPAAAACPQCGHPIAAPVRAAPAVLAQSIPRRGVAVMLALFLGGLGAHKFYLNRPGEGALYLLLCWTFIPAIIALVEAVSYMLTSETEWRAQFAP